MNNWFRSGAGIILTGIGVLGTLFGFLALIDPVGAKMSDDADPLGAPDSLTVGLIKTGFYVLVFVCGVILLKRKSDSSDLI